MRVFGRVYDELGNPTWVEVSTDQNGLNDYVYATALIQELKLNWNESPFYGNRGIPARESVINQVAPDYPSIIMQQRYAPYFLSILIRRVPPGTPNVGQSFSRQPFAIARNDNAPTYQINITTHFGVQIELEIPT